MAVETEELVLKSNVAAIAKRDADALDKLLAASEKVNDSQLAGNLDKSAMLSQVKSVSAELLKQAGIEAKIAGFDAQRAKASADLAKQLKKLNDDATGKTQADADKKRAAEAKKSAADAAKDKFTSGSDFFKDSKGFKAVQDIVGKLFGKDAASQFGKAGESLGKAIDDLGPGGAMLVKGGASVALAAAALAAAAAILVVVGTAKLLLKVAEVAIEQTSFREGATRALDRLTKGNGSKAYDIAINAAVHLGIDKETAVAQTKALLQAGFNQEQIPLALKAIADVSVDLGAEKGNALKEQLGKINRKGVFNQESVNGLAEAGVKAADVYEALKKKGESTAQVMARLKTNQVEAAEGVKAVLAAVEKTSGGAADATKSIPGLLNAISIRFAGMFDKIDTGPLKELLKTVLELFEGTKGDKLKTEITTLGNAIFDLLRPLNTPEGKKALSEGFDKAAAAAHDLAIIVSALGRGLDKVGSSGGFDVLLKAVDALLVPLQTAADLIKLVNGGSDGLGGATPAKPPAAATFDIASAANDNDAADVGGNMAKGVAQGIDANAGAVADSMVGAVNDAVAKAEAALGIASPAKRLVTTGKWSALGMAKGWNDNAGAVADAASGTAQMAASAASGASATGGGGQGASAGAAPQVNLTFIVQGGKDPQSTADAVASMVVPEVRKALRQIQRDMGEGGGSLKSRVA